MLPGGIYACATVEELNTWTAAILQFNHPLNVYTEAANTNPLFHYIQPQLRVPTGELTLVNRSAIIMDETAAQQLPIWKRVRGLSAVSTIAAGFKITG